VTTWTITIAGPHIVAGQLINGSTPSSTAYRTWQEAKEFAADNSKYVKVWLNASLRN